MTLKHEPEVTNRACVSRNFRTRNTRQKQLDNDGVLVLLVALRLVRGIASSEQAESETNTSEYL